MEGATGPPAGKAAFTPRPRALLACACACAIHPLHPNLHFRPFRPTSHPALPPAWPTVLRPRLTAAVSIVRRRVVSWRGPLWRFYPRKRANRLTHEHPQEIDAGVYAYAAPSTRAFLRVVFPRASQACLTRRTPFDEDSSSRCRARGTWTHLVAARMHPQVRPLRLVEAVEERMGLG